MTKEMKFKDDVEVDDIDSTVGITQQKWGWPGSGYNLNTGQLYLDGDKVDELEIIVFEMAQWKNVIIGKRKNKRTVASYPIFTRKTEMEPGDGVENRIQIVMMVNENLYVFGSGAVNGCGAWLKDERNKQYYAADLPMGLWTQLQEHMKRVKAKTGRNVPQFAFSFKIGSGEQINTGGEYEQDIYPLVRKSAFKFVGKERFKELEALYLAEELEEWRETRSNPNGIVMTGDAGTTVTPTQFEEDVPDWTEGDDEPF